jgi:hypothetical protein
LRRAGSRVGPGAVAPGLSGAPGLSATGLQKLLQALGGAKRRLLTETAALREVESRVRDWDAREAFQARRGQVLRSEAALRFSQALDGLEGLLRRLSHDDLGVALRTRPRGARARRLLVEICCELRYLQRAFDGGNLLLAGALATFAAPEL